MFHSLKIGVSHTYGSGLSHTYDRDVTQTDFEAVEQGIYRAYSSIENPMLSTASLTSESLMPSPLTVATPLWRSTDTDSTPLTERMTFSTLARQWLQVMPLIWKKKTLSPCPSPVMGRGEPSGVFAVEEQAASWQWQWP